MCQSYAYTYIVLLAPDGATLAQSYSYIFGILPPFDRSKHEKGRKHGKVSRGRMVQRHIFVLQNSLTDRHLNAMFYVLCVYQTTWF